MKKLAMSSILVATVLVLGITYPWNMPNASAAGSSVTGTGTFGASLVEACFGWQFDLNVSGKQSGPGDATGTFKLSCPSLEGESTTSSIDTIVSITGETAHVRGQLSLTQIGVRNCVDQDGTPVTHIITNIKVQEAPGTIHPFGEFPPGVTSITCQGSDDPETLPSEREVLVQPFDMGVRELTSGSITVNP